MHRKDKNLTSWRLTDIFQTPKLSYFTIKMNCFANDFSFQKFQAHAFKKEQILPSTSTVDQTAFVLGDRFGILFSQKFIVLE